MKERTRKIIVAGLLLVAVCCAGYLIWYYSMAAKTKQSYDDAKKLAKEKVTPSKEEKKEEPKQAKPEIPIDFSVLQEKNPDIYAWIKIDGTTVDYPICQNFEDDNYYLTHTWERAEAADGAIFTQACNSKNFMDFNTVVYGHQMGEGVDTMFHTLDRYLEEGYIEKYPTVEIYTPEHILTYRIFAAVIYDDRHLVNSFNYTVDSQKQEFLNSLSDAKDMRNRYNNIENVGITDRILSLSTCVTGESNHRLLVEAVLTNEE
ncbi:class B sortase [Coprococcus comes]|uniref:class B sortase n=1 Tax=Coprococcus comes TaxID=410072 RepID=UPI001898B72E|nr:class B sortase [Coprococcus comes]